MPYQPPSPGTAGFAIVAIAESELPKMVNRLVEEPPILSSNTRDSINSAGPHFLDAFNNQVLSRQLSLNTPNASIANLARPGMDCVVALTDTAGTAFLVGVKLFMLTTNCYSTPLLPAPVKTGELPVIAYLVKGAISRSNVYFSLVYFFNHDLADLFGAVLGHAGMFSPHWRPFPAGERKTVDPPVNLVNAILEDAAECLRQMPLADLEKLEIHVKGFLHVQNALDITDMGFRELIRVCCTIVNRALRRPGDLQVNRVG
ncbi:hypothetical protein F5146DRAFT_1185410 [Armillaria mellea]|nr:hypothetical protein F5146DRAFT_1185410 [Armillaria mellea]